MSDRSSMLKPHGQLLRNGVAHADTRQCCHCGRHFVYRKGSGKIRGWCGTCNDVFCGPQCEKCVPMEQQLDNMSAGRDVLWMPSSVSVLPTSPKVIDAGLTTP